MYMAAIKNIVSRLTSAEVIGGPENEHEVVQSYTFSNSVQTNLGCVPKQRLLLGNYPTPLQPWKFSWKEKYYKCWIKRDDLTDMVASGNKIRRLEFILPEVLEGNHDGILSIGPCQSNSCRVVTAVAPRLGLKSAHVLINTANTEPSFTQGNLFFHNLFGSKLIFKTRNDYCTKGQETLLEEARLKLVQEKEIVNPFVLPMGGSTIHGVFGYIEAFKEIEEQILNLNLDIERIIVPCGSGGTVTGLAIGKYLSQNLRNVELIGCIVWDSPVEYFYQYANDVLSQLGLSEKVKAEELVKFVVAHESGYGKSTEEELDLMRSVARSSGIVLDGTYTVKALKTCLDTLEDGMDEKCLLLHTGGLFSLIGREEYCSK